MLNAASNWLFASDGLTPHGFCLLWRPGLIWTYALSDIGIGLAYFTIPIALALFARTRQDLIYAPIFWLFAAFILLCGTTHWLDLLTLWVPAYGVQAAVKAATAMVSLGTAVVLWRLLPGLLALPSSAQLRAVNTALADSEARYRASFQRSPMPLYTKDADEVVTDASDSLLALLGYARHEVVGQHIDAFRAPGSPVMEPQDRARLLADGVLNDQPRLFQRRDGTIIEALVSLRLDTVDGVTSIICVLLDVTARNRAEAALRASDERLRQSQKMEAVGQLTGGIAHDFNNMLQGIVGCLDRIEQRIAQNQPQDIARYVAAARSSADRATTLTSRMLAFARRQPLQARLIDPAALVQDMADLVSRTIGPAVQLTLRLQAGWQVHCDANQLENALLNLAINARDAMPQGGELTIATTDRCITAADAQDAVDGEYLEIAVTDTGLGMSPDVQRRVFEPFFTTKPLGQGTGLGLSQVYGFVRQSGGWVRVDSRENQGTTVTLLLPRMLPRIQSRTGQDGPGNEPTEPDPGLLSAPASTPRLSHSVLLVDDEAGLRALMAEALQDQGCRVTQAADGASGLTILQSSAPFDLLVTDIGLPGLNGRQLADAARTIRPGLPVLLITGYAGTALDAAGIEPGFEIMLKPFGLEALCSRAGALIASTDPAAAPQPPAAPATQLPVITPAMTH